MSDYVTSSGHGHIGLTTAATTGRAVADLAAGRDPRGFSIMAFGGSGGVHAVSLARELKAKRVIVPPAGGVFSAVGLLLENLELNLSRAFPGLAAAMDLAEMERVYSAIETEIVSRLGHSRADVTLSRWADMRYAGQAFEITVPLTETPIEASAITALGQRFEREHQRRYGHSFEGAYPLETVNLRAIGTVRPAQARVIAGTASEDAVPESTRRVYFGPEVGVIETPVVSRSGISADARAGPLIIEEYEGTVIVPPGCDAHLDATTSIIIEDRESQ